VEKEKNKFKNFDLNVISEIIKNAKFYGAKKLELLIFLDKHFYVVNHQIIDQIWINDSCIFSKKMYVVLVIKIINTK
jgi:hypothetical protein